jgi:hypothetical protein
VNVADRNGDAERGYATIEAMRNMDKDFAAALALIERYNERLCDQNAKLRREKRGLKRALKRALAESGVTTDGVTATQDSAPVWVITVSGVPGVTVIPWQAEV